MSAEFPQRIEKLNLLVAIVESEKKYYHEELVDMLSKRLFKAGFDIYQERYYWNLLSFSDKNSVASSTKLENKFHVILDLINIRHNYEPTPEYKELTRRIKESGLPSFKISIHDTTTGNFNKGSFEFDEYEYLKFEIEVKLNYGPNKNRNNTNNNNNNTTAVNSNNTAPELEDDEDEFNELSALLPNINDARLATKKALAAIHKAAVTEIAEIITDEQAKGKHICNYDFAFGNNKNLDYILKILRGPKNERYTVEITYECQSYASLIISWN